MICFLLRFREPWWVSSDIFSETTFGDEPGFSGIDGTNSAVRLQTQNLVRTNRFTAIEFTQTRFVLCGLRLNFSFEATQIAVPNFSCLLEPGAWRKSEATQPSSPTT